MARSRSSLFRGIERFVAFRPLLCATTIGQERSQIVKYPARIWIRRLAGPDLVFVLACGYACATFEGALERSETLKTHLIGDAGNCPIIGLYAPLGVIDPQYGEPAAKAHPDLMVKKAAEISALKPDDICRLGQADILVVMLFAKRSQAPQLRIVRKCGVSYVVRSTVAQLRDLPLLICTSAKWRSDSPTILGSFGESSMASRTKRRSVAFSVPVLRRAWLYSCNC